ncbi:glucosyltransferase domain-containing protein [Enterobacter ludwigii]|uniref:glucosyltransferase domain-containing protein n=1 Tax=Enterobacter ludwigii TaxID=299767 RepID=UPI003F7104E9
MNNKDDNKMLLMYSGLALLFIYPLIQAGVFYRDDLDRSITGQYGWRGLGRPLADDLMRFLSASGHYNLDLFPYTAIVSCLFLGISALLLSKHLIKMEVPYPKYIASLLIFNPYLLQNNAYKYDSLGMSLAFLLSILAYTYTNTKLKQEISVKISTGVLALTLYQPCTNIFIGLLALDVFIIAFKAESKPHQILKNICMKAFILISFYVAYMAIFSPKHNSRSELIKPTTEGFKNLLQTIKNLSNLFSSYFHHPVYIYFLAPLLAIIFLIAMNVYQKKLKLFKVVILSIFACLIFLISLMGPTIFLVDAPVLPRTLVSFSIIFLFIAIPIVYLSPSLKYLALVPVITAFAFSAQLSSALKSQSEHEEYIFSMISRDLIKHPTIETIVTVGQVSVSERAKLIVKSKPLINYFLSPATQFLASFQLINKGFIQTTRGYGEEDDNKKTLLILRDEGIKPIVSNKEYAIYLKDNLAIIQLGR